MSSYIETFEEFLASHPDIKPEWRELLEPVFAAEDQQMLSYILSYLFM